jgi:hypothetical protein
VESLVTPQVAKESQPRFPLKMPSAMDLTNVGVLGAGGQGGSGGAGGAGGVGDNLSGAGRDSRGGGGGRESLAGRAGANGRGVSQRGVSQRGNAQSGNAQGAARGDQNQNNGGQNNGGQQTKEVTVDDARVEVDPNNSQEFYNMSGGWKQQKKAVNALFHMNLRNPLILLNVFTQSKEAVLNIGFLQVCPHVNFLQKIETFLNVVKSVISFHDPFGKISDPKELLLSRVKDGKANAFDDPNFTGKGNLKLINETRYHNESIKVLSEWNNLQVILAHNILN